MDWGCPPCDSGYNMPPDLPGLDRIQLGRGGLVLIGKAVDLKSTGGNPLQVRVLHPPPYRWALKDAHRYGLGCWRTRTVGSTAPKAPGRKFLSGRIDHNCFFR